MAIQPHGFRRSLVTSLRDFTAKEGGGESRQLQPVVVNPSTRPTPRAWTHPNLRCAAIIPDMQVGFKRSLRDGSLEPFHDRAAIDVAWQIIRAEAGRLSEIVLLGDNLDLPEWSLKFTRSPEVYWTTQPSLVELAWWYAQLPSGPKIHAIEGNHECFDRETRAITRRGFSSVDELTIGDEVLSCRDDGSAVWVPIERIIRRAYTGEMVRFNTKNVDSMTTPNHRVVGRSAISGEWREFLAKDVGVTFKAVCAASGTQHHGGLSDRQIRLAAWCHTDSWASPGGKRWVFYQRESKAARIRELLDSLDIYYREVIRNRSIEEICDKKLKQTPEPGHEFTVKHDALSSLVPDKDSLGSWAWCLSEAQVDVLVDEWVYTDGAVPTRSTKSRVIYCSRDNLRRQLMALLCANGYRVSETEYRPGHWRINLSKRTVSKLFSNRKPDDVQRVPYSGEVWCLSVPNERFFVERSGKVFLSGNCRLRTMVLEKSLAAYDLRAVHGGYPVLSVENLLGLDAMGIAYHGPYPHGEVWLNEHIRLHHGEVVRAKSGGTVRSVVDNVLHTEGQGHIHRFELAQRTSWTAGGPHFNTAFSPGTLARIDPGAVPGAISRQNWQQGIAFVEYEADGPGLHVDMIPIHQGRAIFRGKVYTARPMRRIVQHIETDTKFKVS